MEYRTRLVPTINQNSVSKYDTYYYTGTCTNPQQQIFSNSVERTYQSLYRSEVMHDMVVPRFRARSLKGEIFNNPADKTIVEVVREPIRFDYESINFAVVSCSGVPTTKWTGGTGMFGYLDPTYYLGAGYLAVPALSQSEATVRNIAFTQANSKVGESEVGGLVIMAEAGETIRSFCQIVSRLIRIGRNLKKWNLRGIAKEFTAKQLADRWMEGRYAVRPVVYDIYDVVSALRNFRIYEQRETARGWGDCTATALADDVVTYYVSNDYQIRARKTSSQSITARAGVLSAVEAVYDSARWGFTDPVGALWDLIPFSFVVDRFLNVGQTLAAWTPKYGYKQLASWVTVTKTVFQEIMTQRAVDLAPPSSSRFRRSVTASGGRVTSTTTQWYRLPNPELAVLPEFSVRLDASFLLDLTILAKRTFSSIWS